MQRVVRSFLAVQAAVFAIAALLHAGMLAGGYEHERARTAETVIAAVLLAGLVATFVAPAVARRAALAAQGFALFGTAVGLVTIAIGIGPRTMVDFALHATMIALLATGLVVTARVTGRSRSRA
jgi:hypothetical protein